jgi:hypothetical protein
MFEVRFFTFQNSGREEQGGSFILMAIVFNIEKANLNLVKKIEDLNSEEEWLMFFYRQFGFEDYEELKSYMQSHENFFDNFSIPLNQEALLFGKLAALYPVHKRKRLIKFYKQAHEKVGPSNVAVEI